MSIFLTVYFQELTPAKRKSVKLLNNCSFKHSLYSMQVWHKPNIDTSSKENSSVKITEKETYYLILVRTETIITYNSLWIKICELLKLFWWTIYLFLSDFLWYKVWGNPILRGPSNNTWHCFDTFPTPNTLFLITYFKPNMF